MTVQLHHREAGEGSPMLLMHGLFGSSRNWASVQRKLADHRRVFALDLRNHGASGRADTMGYSEMADDVDAWIDEQGLEGPLTVLGHSMGGKVAMMLALAHPQRVQRLVVVDIAPVRYPPHHTDIVAALRDLDLSALQSRRDAEARLRTAIADDEVRAFLLQNLVQNDGQFAWRMHLPGIAASLGALGDFPAPAPAAAWQGPALFIRGGASDYVTSEGYEAIGNAFPQARIVSLPGVGHWPHAQAPDEFIAQILPFVASD